MARKYDEIKWLAQATAQDLSADTEKWKGYIENEPYVLEHVWDKIEIESANVVIANSLSSDFGI